MTPRRCPRPFGPHRLTTMECATQGEQVLTGTDTVAGRWHACIAQTDRRSAKKDRIHSERSGAIRHANASTLAHSRRRTATRGKRPRVGRDAELPFLPPEDWHEPFEDGRDYRIVTQDPGRNYRHVVTAQEVRDRLSRLPERFLEVLEVVQLSRMTRKKQNYPCYGMQWGSTIYLYPMEVGLTETYVRPPKPAQFNEARAYGGQWRQQGNGRWQLQWNERHIKDFFLENILIHELGHMLDDRNTSYADRERYAEWFATRYGNPLKSRSPRKRDFRRRHHAT